MVNKQEVLEIVKKSYKDIDKKLDYLLEEKDVFFTPEEEDLFDIYVMQKQVINDIYNLIMKMEESKQDD